MVHLVLVWFTY